jgi:polyisoprenoid-binding protein YceI
MTRVAVRRALLAAAWLAAASAGAPGLALAGPVRFVVVPERSRVEFVSATQLGEFRGGTGAVTGEVAYDPEAPARSRLVLALDPRTLRSDNAARDRHMHERVLEVARFPAITLADGAFTPDGASSGTVSGRLALHGVERPVSIPVRFTLEGRTLRAEGRFTVALTDFGMAPPRLLGLKVRDAVTVEIRLVAAKA